MHPDAAAVQSARALVAEAAQCRWEAVPPDAGIATFDRWDSLVHMRITLSIEDRLGRELDAAEILALESITDIARLLAGARST